MQELIKVDFRGEQGVVSARELHRYLEAETDFRHWFPRMCEYGFAEGEDFNTVKIDRVQNEGDRLVTRQMDDAALSMDMAKEICMIQRTEKGKLARQYFLKLEKDWNSPEKVMARALQIADRKIMELSVQAERDKSKVLFANAVSASKNSILVGELAKLLKQNGVDMGQNRLFAWMRDKGYLIKRKGSDYSMPTQRSMELGLFEIKETVVVHSDGHTTVNKTTKVSGKGQQFFVCQFLQA